MAEAIIGVGEHAVEGGTADQLECLAHAGVHGALTLARQKPGRFAKDVEKLVRRRNSLVALPFRSRAGQLGGAQTSGVTLKLHGNSQGLALTIQKLLGSESAN